MSRAHPPTPDIPLPEALRLAATQVADRDPPAVAALLAPLVQRLRDANAATSNPKELVDATLAVCQQLFGQGRSGETLELTAALGESCARAGDRVQLRRATYLRGMVLSDGGDPVGAVEHYVQALRLASADEDRGEMARVWGNLGVTFIHAGRYELSARCSHRCLALLEPMIGPSLVRRAALSNLAQCCYHLGRIPEGLHYGELALAETEAMGDDTIYGAILLHRNMARLLLDNGCMDEAEEHVASALVLAERANSPRAAIAAEMTRAAHDLATGSADLALTRIDRTLAQARRVPATLRDALACAVRAEEAAGYPARALMRLQELSSHIYGDAVGRTRRAIELSGLEAAEPLADDYQERIRDRLVERLDPPAPPPGWAMMRRLAASAVLPMDETGSHGVRVGTLVRELARGWGCRPLEGAELGRAAELHDIGMTTVPGAVLQKQGPLNEGERAIVQRHPDAGAAMLVDGPQAQLLLAHEIALYHHCRWDGLGYPARVAGNAIPLGARMCAIADAYDAMVCGIGQVPRSMNDALHELHRQAGRQFDPQLVSCFDAVVKSELENHWMDPGAPLGMQDFLELVAALREDRGFV